MSPRSLASSPTTIGALTVLVVTVAVFLAYNANNGLPFVPTYRMSVGLHDADTLVPGNEVRIGGVRVGVIDEIEPQQAGDGSVWARLDLKLEADAEPIPVDSTVTVRAKSALGLKYLEINKGNSPRALPQGGTMPLSAARPEPVELDQILNTFDEQTRAAVQTNLLEFGEALAGRGAQLNAALGRLPSTLEVLRPVMRNLGAPRTGLERFIEGLSSTFAEVAPVADVQAAMFGSLDTTFTALAEVARPYIQDSISGAPPTEEAAIETLPHVRTLLANTTAALDDLSPAAAALDENAPTIATALETGTPVVARSSRLNEQLAPTFESLLGLTEDASARAGIAAATDAADELGPAMRFIAPAQTVCNYAALLTKNLFGVVSDGNDLGAWQRFIVFDVPQGANNEGGPSSAPANGGGDERNFLHSNAYPNTAAPGQAPRECEAGNEDYITGRQVIGNAPGDQGTVTAGQ